MATEEVIEIIQLHAKTRTQMMPLSSCVDRAGETSS